MQTDVLLAFDYGKRRIGVALGIGITSTARPLDTVIRKDQGDEHWTTIARHIEEWKPTHLLVGWPTHDRDEPHPLEKEITRFVNQLKHRYQLPVSLVDETFSSFEAAERLKSQRQSGRKRRINKSELDQQSAAILLENWFNS